MNKTEKLELEQMNGVDPYEDETENGIPMWLYALLLASLMGLAAFADCVGRFRAALRQG